MIQWGKSLLRGPARAPRRSWRERSWSVISRDDYQLAFDRLGGSIHVHPTVVALAAELSGMEPRFIALRRGTAITAALPVLGGLVGGTLESLAACNILRHLDLGNSEVILPLAGTGPIRLPLPVANLSCLHAAGIAGATPQPNRHMIARPHSNGEHQLSSRFLSTHRRKLRQFLEGGGSVLPVNQLSSTDIAAAYERLFQSRFGYAPHDAGMLPHTLERLRPLLRGSVLLLRNIPIAIQIIYAHAGARGLLAVYVNGGVDQKHRNFSPGSILYYLNTQALHAEAEALGLPLRYSFGFDDHDYKQSWCVDQPLYRTG